MAGQAQHIFVLSGGEWISSDLSTITLWRDTTPIKRSYLSCGNGCELSDDNRLLYGDRKVLSIEDWRVSDYKHSHAGDLPPFGQIDYWHPSPDGEHAVLQGTVRRTDLRREGDGADFRHIVSTDGKQQFTLDVQGRPSAGWSKSFLAVSHSANNKSSLRLFDRRTKFKQIIEIPSPATYMMDPKFSGDESRVAARVNPNEVAVWDIKGKLLVQATSGDLSSYCWDLRDDGKRLAIGYGKWERDGTIEIWDVDAAKLVRTIKLDRVPEEIVWHRSQLWVSGTDGSETRDHRIYRLSAK